MTIKLVFVDKIGRSKFLLSTGRVKRITTHLRFSSFHVSYSRWTKTGYCKFGCLKSGDCSACVYSSWSIREDYNKFEPLENLKSSIYSTPGRVRNSMLIRLISYRCSHNM